MTELEQEVKLCAKFNRKKRGHEMEAIVKINVDIERESERKQMD